MCECVNVEIVLYNATHFQLCVTKRCPGERFSFPVCDLYPISKFRYKVREAINTIIVELYLLEDSPTGQLLTPLVECDFRNFSNLISNNDISSLERSFKTLFDPCNRVNLNLTSPSGGGGSSSCDRYYPPQVSTNPVVRVLVDFNRSTPLGDYYSASFPTLQEAIDHCWSAFQSRFPDEKIHVDIAIASVEPNKWVDIDLRDLQQIRLSSYRADMAMIGRGPEADKNYRVPVFLSSIKYNNGLTYYTFKNLDVSMRSTRTTNRSFITSDTSRTPCSLGEFYFSNCAFESTFTITNGRKVYNHTAYDYFFDPILDNCLGYCIITGSLFHSREMVFRAYRKVEDVFCEFSSENTVFCVKRIEIDGYRHPTYLTGLPVEPWRPPYVCGFMNTVYASPFNSNYPIPNNLGYEHLIKIGPNVNVLTLMDNYFHRLIWDYVGNACSADNRQEWQEVARSKVVNNRQITCYTQSLGSNMFATRPASTQPIIQLLNSNTTCLDFVPASSCPIQLVRV